MNYEAYIHDGNIYEALHHFERMYGNRVPFMVYEVLCEVMDMSSSEFFKRYDLWKEENL